MSESEERAKATYELAKLGTTTVEKVSDVTGFIAKYVDEPLSVLVGQ